MRKLLFRLIMAAALGMVATAARADDLDLNSYLGKVVYLDFWASWCGPCKQSFPWLDHIQTAYRDNGLVVVAVNLDKERRLAEQFLQEHPAALQVIFDPQGVLAKRYHLKAMPTSIVIGRDGRIRAVHAGFNAHETNDYLAGILAALNEPGPQSMGKN